MPLLPEIPAQDFFLALSSAGVLLWLAIYLAQPGDEETDTFVDGLFHLPAEAGARRHLSFLGSLFSHILIIAAIPLLQVLFPDSLAFQPKKYDMVVLQFSTPEEPLRVPPEVSRMLDPDWEPRLRSSGLESLESESEQNASGDGSAGEGGPEDGEASGKKQPERAIVEIILPEMPPPSAFGEIPQPGPEIALTIPPSANDSESMIWTFDQTPVEDLYNPDVPALADLGVSIPVLSDTGDLSPLPPSSMLQADRLPESIGMIAGLERPLGDSERFGNMLATNGSGFDPRSPAWALRNELANGAFGRLFGGAGGGPGEGNGNGGEGRAGDGSGDGSGWGGVGAGQGPGFGRGSPVPRKYQGIILISNSTSAMPEAVGVLKGNPVYTVYVEVPNSPRKWVLQFCETEDSNPSLEYTDSGVIKVKTQKRIDLPFALHKTPLELRFNEEQLLSLPRRIVVYAKLSADGELDNFRVVSGAEPDLEPTIIAGLRNWEFSPAFRDGRPVAVEALFGIPLR